MTTQKFDVTKHILVPKHSKVSDKERKDLLQKYKISADDLPRILKNDPAIAHLGPKLGDIIKIERDSPTAGKMAFYRVVVSE